MEDYIVSARKYRPSTFESVVGQQSLTQTLRNAIRSNHLAHAYLFCGPRGVGKTTCARIFAKTINCLHPTAEHDACNECESCLAFNEQRSFNIHELDAASNNSVEDIRSIIDQVRIPPQIGQYSVYIIDEVHMLSQGAFNALLKTLEEPPSYAIFILATTEKHKVLPTILSRCQVYDFSRITVADTIRHLQYVAAQEGITVGEEALNVVAQKADGGMRDALSIFDQLVSYAGKDITYEKTIEVLNVLDSEYYFKLVDAALEGRYEDMLLTLDEVLCKGFDAGHFVTGFAQHLRDVLVSRESATAELLETSASIRQHYFEQAQRCPARWLFQALDIMNTCDIQYRQAKNKRLTVELALLKLTQLLIEQPGVAPAKERPVSTPATPKTVNTPSTIRTAPQATPKPESVATNISAGDDIPQPTSPKEVKTSTVPLTTLKELPQMPTMTIPTAKESTTLQSSSSEPTPTTQPQERPFTIDQLRDVWAGLGVHFPKEERLVAMLMQAQPEILNPRLCRITMTNTLQKKEFAKWGKQVMDIVRNELHNDFIHLQVDVEAYDKTQVAYTAQEKYKVLAAENPQLNELKKRLSLQLI